MVSKHNGRVIGAVNITKPLLTSTVICYKILDISPKLLQYSGIIYDLFECLAGQMEMNGLTSIPLFFLSPVADSSLAYSNIMAEWLSIAKHNRVYLPEVRLA